MNCYFKYKLESGGGSMYTPRDLNWIERFTYRLKGYRVVRIDEKYWKAHPVDNSKKTIVTLQIKY